MKIPSRDRRVLLYAPPFAVSGTTNITRIIDREKVNYPVCRLCREEVDRFIVETRIEDQYIALTAYCHGRVCSFNVSEERIFSGMGLSSIIESIEWFAEDRDRIERSADQRREVGERNSGDAAERWPSGKRLIRLDD